MTNEEKAREIAEYYTDINDIGVALNSAKEMAEWKDHQFREILRKKWKESQVNPNDNELRIALFVDEIMDIFFGEEESGHNAKSI